MSWLLNGLLLFLLACVVGTVIVVVVVLLGQQYWKRRNIYTLKTTVPLIGHMGKMILRKQSFADLIHSFYNELKGAGKDFGGIYQFQRPSLVLCNPDLIGEVMTKQFEHFVNRRPLVDQKVDKLWGRSLLALQDDQWREMRHHLSPAFTGAKLRGMIGLIESTCSKFSMFLSKRPDFNEPIDIYESFRRMAADLIATTAFGSPSDSINDPESEFYKNGTKIMAFTGARSLVLVGYLMSPALMMLLNIPFVPTSLRNFFFDIINRTIKFREKENKSRADMIQLLLDARAANPSKYIENNDIAAQAFTFFLGGFDTMATAFSLTSHVMALHPDMQIKIREEVKTVMANNNGKMTYDALKELKYMDMFIAEVLRMHPVAPMLDRLCSSNVSFPEFGLTLERGAVVFIPVYGFHYDPEYFPDPYKFDPERFSDENKHNIKPNTYLPFGEGPRKCIAQRFALMEMKLGLAQIILNNEFQVCEKTNVKTPFEYKKGSPLMIPEGGFWLNIKPVSSE